MLRSSLSLLLTAAGVLILVPRQAAADWVITPSIGWSFGSAAAVNAGAARDNTLNSFARETHYGVSVARMGVAAIGLELDLSHSPSFFENSTPVNAFRFTRDSNLTTATANLAIGGRTGDQHKSVRPYLVAGGGLIRTRLQGVQQSTMSAKNDLGIDVGGGVIAFFTQHVGLRGDVRYFRGFRGRDAEFTGLALGDFHFWRGSVGVSVKF